MKLEEGSRQDGKGYCRAKKEETARPGKQSKEPLWGPGGGKTKTNHDRKLLSICFPAKQNQKKTTVRRGGADGGLPKTEKLRETDVATGLT